MRNFLTNSYDHSATINEETMSVAVPSAARIHEACMKIILVNNARVVSGAEEYMLDLAKRIGAYGYLPHFFVHVGGILEGKIKALRYPCHSVFTRNPLKVVFSIAAALIKEKPDVVLIAREHNIYPIIAGYLLASPLLKKKPRLVAVLQTPTARRYPLAVRFLDGVIATSEYTGKSFFPVNPGMEKITSIIHYGIEILELQNGKDNPNRPRRILKDRSFPVIGMVGELWKNQTELIDVGTFLVKSFPDITIAIVGGGNDSELREKIAKSGLDRNFVLTGRIPREQIPDLFYDFDLSVSTHRNEGFGIVHIESLAASTPVVAYNSGGLTEIIRKGGGVLVDGGTQDFASEISRLLFDSRKRLELGSEGRIVAEACFTLDTMTRNHVKFFEKLC
jgi:glycosyltransferase involved in cell wall biosynthesis